MNFKPLLFLFASAFASAEVLTLVSDDHFIGELISISPEKGVIMKSPRSPEPIAFKADAFSQLEMEGPSEADPFETERLMLTNGDILPGNLHSLDENTLVYEGLVGGLLNLKRTQINSLRFGIKPESLLYSGPAPLADWTGDAAETWVMDDQQSDSLLLLESGQIEQEVGLGQQFKIQFNLKWEDEPAIRIYFGCDLEQNSPRDRYYIDINDDGVQVRRERSTEPRFNMLVSLLQNEAFDDKEANVEIQVNRLLGTLNLYLDGKLIRQMEDLAPPTTGDAIIIERKRSDKPACYLSGLKVLEWDAVSQVQLLEEVGNKDSDSLVDVEGKSISGTILHLAQKVSETETLGEKKAADHFVLQSPFADEPIQVPTRKTRLIYFRGDNAESTASDFPKYELDLANDGLVSAKKIQLSDDEATLEHPLLGDIKLPRSAIKSIRFLTELTDEEE